MTDNVSCIFRPLNALEKSMKSLNIVDCPNNREVVVKERAVDKITRTFAFDRVFGPNSRQVSMSVFICSFLYFFDTLDVVVVVVVFVFVLVLFKCNLY